MRILLFAYFNKLALAALPYVVILQQQSSTCSKLYMFKVIHV